MNFSREFREPSVEARAFENSQPAQHTLRFNRNPWLFRTSKELESGDWIQLITESESIVKLYVVSLMYKMEATSLPRCLVSAESKEQRISFEFPLVSPGVPVSVEKPRQTVQDAFESFTPLLIAPPSPGRSKRDPVSSSEAIRGLIDKVCCNDSPVDWELEFL